MASPHSQYAAHPGYGAPYHAVPTPANPTYAESRPAPAEEPAKKKINWPESVRNYVQRSFMAANIDPDVSRTEMEAKLKETIAPANETGVM